MATLIELTTALRQRLDDEVAPLLWSDEELYSYLNEAQREACIRALLLRDRSTVDVAVYDITATESFIELSPLVLYVEPRARITGKEINEISEDSLRPGWQAHTGQPDKFFVDSTGLYLYPEPLENDTLTLTVFRLPLADMALLIPASGPTPEVPAVDPEIPLEHHYRLVDWAARCAYLKRDSDAHDEKLAEKHDILFTKSFGVRPDANVRTKRNLQRADKVKFRQF